MEKTGQNRLPSAVVKTRNSIYQSLYNAKEPLSKQEIAQLLGLSLPHGTPEYR